MNCSDERTFNKLQPNYWQWILFGLRISLRVAILSLLASHGLLL